MCGLCSPHCPTYLKTRDEGESPRGRIALINALVNKQLPPTPQLGAHLDNCLLCRSCEVVCPAGVPMASLIDRIRAVQRATSARHKKGIGQRLLDVSLARPWLLRIAGKALRVYERSGIRHIARHTGLINWAGLSRIDALLPAIPAQRRWQLFYPAQGRERGIVALFTGCATGLLDNATLMAAIRVLNRLGVGVHVPRGQVCCGALHQHRGEPEIAQRLAGENMHAFSATGNLPVVGVASGCTAMLLDYRHLAYGDSAAMFSRRISDINHFLIDLDWPNDVTVEPLRKRVAVHLPCSMTNTLRDHTSPFELLHRIPGAEIVELPNNRLCCGAAGSYMVEHPVMADALLGDKLDQLQQLKPDILMTENIGCALHFRQGLKQRGLDIEVMHPVALLQRQLRLADS